MIIISTPLTVRVQPSPRFHVEAWLPFRNYEIDYLTLIQVISAKTQFGVSAEPH